MGTTARRLGSGVLPRCPYGRLSRALVPLAVVASLSLTACQDDSEPAAAPSSVPSESSPATSPSTPGSSAEPDVEPSATPSLDAASLAFLDRMAEGMGRNGTAHLEMTVSGAVRTRSYGVMRYGGGGSEIDLTTELPGSGEAGQKMQLVVLRDAAYISAPGFTPRGKYLRVDKDSPRFQELAGASISMSPEQSVKAFRAGLISARKVGQETIQGVRTTRYAVKADAVRALEAQGSSAVPGMPETITYQVWLDGQDRMRRMGLVIQATRLQIDISDWGEPVEIAAPPRSALVKTPPGF